MGFIRGDRDQMYLLPPSIRDWLPENDLAWFIIDAVGQMDLGAFYTDYHYEDGGRPAYDPVMMVTVLLYAYCLGERSSRRIEWLCQRDIAFRVITGNLTPDHVTIARFRQRFEKPLGDLFTQVLRLCVEAGLVRVGVVALDGTKVKANASLTANRTYASIKEEVQKWLKEAKAVDDMEDRLYGPDRRGDELPPELSDRKSRLARLKACKERLEQDAAERAAEQKARVEQRKARERAMGKKLRGRKPKAPDDSVDAHAKANVTDPDSRIMKTRGGYLQGYNAQVVVTEEQIIIAADVTCEENDVGQLHPMLMQAQANLDAVGCRKRIKAAAADAGYWSEANAAQEQPEGPELFIATSKDWKQRKAQREQKAPRGRIPRNLTLRERMERKLLTRRGREIYKKRSMTVEPVFGQMKAGRGCNRFMRRGLYACISEWLLICATHNLLKLWNYVKSNLGRGSNAMSFANV